MDPHQILIENAKKERKIRIYKDSVQQTELWRVSSCKMIGMARSCLEGKERGSQRYDKRGQRKDPVDNG